MLASSVSSFDRKMMTQIARTAVLAPPQEAICALLFKVEAVVPYSRGDLLSRVHELGACDVEEYTDAGTLIQVRWDSRLCERAPWLFLRGVDVKTMDDDWRRRRREYVESQQ